jgi:hypothetical protein
MPSTSKAVLLTPLPAPCLDGLPSPRPLPLEDEVKDLRRRLREQELATEALEQRVRDLEELEEQRVARRARTALRPLLLANCRITTSPSRVSSSPLSSPPLTPPETETAPITTASPSSWAMILAPRPLPSLATRLEEEIMPRPPTLPPPRQSPSFDEEASSKAIEAKPAARPPSLVPRGDAKPKPLRRPRQCQTAPGPSRRPPPPSLGQPEKLVTLRPRPVQPSRPRPPPEPPPQRQITAAPRRGRTVRRGAAP